MYFEELQLGYCFETEPTRIEKEEMLAFARRYDPIPLHLDEEYAKSTRFGGLIAPGVMTFMSVWAKYLEQDLCGEELIAGLSTHIRWVKPVFADDVLTGKGEITALTPHGHKSGVAEITIHAYNQNGELVLTDVTEALVARRTPLA